MSRALRSPFVALLGLLAVAGALLLAMYLYDQARDQQIANGIRIEGIDVGGLSATQAQERLRHTVVADMERPVIASSAGKSWRITPRQAAVTVDVDGTVAEALGASQSGSIFTRTWRGLTGGRIDRDLSLRVAYSHAAVHGFVAKVRQALNREPKDATVQPGSGGLTQEPSQTGLAVESERLRGRVASALTNPGAKRSVMVPVRIVQPPVTTKDLATKYPAYIVVNRSRFRLYFYENLKLASTYEIAVGMQGLETTPGLYHVQWKQVNPPWYVPHSKWAGSLAGKTIPPGPQDPLKARFMAFNGGAGIHGIAPSEYSSIGHDASHGCVRMRIPDVIALYSRTPVGTPVYVI